jgi:hypothetical protein
MALQRFWSVIQNARSLFFGRVNESVDSGRRADTSSLMDAVRQTADVWFTPDLVKDYDEADFTFLSDDERTKLRQAVDEFRRLAAQSQSGPPSTAQIERGYDLFVMINNLIAPHLGEELDLRRIADATRSVPWANYILGADYRIGTDSTGDPAVWIRLIVKDDVEIESPTVQAELARVRGAYREAIQKAGIERWPYITVRTRSEVKDLIGGSA